MLEIENVSRVFPARQGMFGKTEGVRALHEVSLSVRKGESFGLVGESGSGKTTLTRQILRLDTPTSGRILFEGEDMAHLSPAALRALRAKVQIVFQDPYASLNPRMSVHDIVTEPMLIHRATLGLNRQQRTDRAAELLELVGLGPQHLYRHPHEFSGGQRQRICIARALAPGPSLVLLDEPTSALDVSIQAEILNLLKRLRKERGLTYLMVTHNLPVVAFMCDRLAVMRHGRIEEIASAEALKTGALATPYARELYRLSNPEETAEEQP